MELKVCEDEDQINQLVTDWCRTEIQHYQAKSIYLPAGKTPESLYLFWEKARPEFLNGIRFLQIDDVLTGVQSGVFKDFFMTHLPSYSNQFVPIMNGDGQADLAILGLGLNGHVAFHEPGIPENFFSGCIPLNVETCSRLELEMGTWGISYGLGAFQRAKAILILVKGKSKREILKRLLIKQQDLPATFLLDHPNLTIICDRLAFDE